MHRAQGGPGFVPVGVGSAAPDDSSIFDVNHGEDLTEVFSLAAQQRRQPAQATQQPAQVKPEPEPAADPVAVSAAVSAWSQYNQYVPPTLNTPMGFPNLQFRNF